jgi:hypothetical protein
MSGVEPIGGPTCLLAKICSKCGVEYALEAFSRSRASKDGRRSECKSCFAEYYRKYYEENSEKERAAQRKYYEENRESVAAAQRKYYAENRERETLRASAWKKANPHVCNAIRAKRRAAKLRQTPAWVTATENEEIKKLYQLAGNLSASTGVPHHVDHIRPLQGRKIAGLHCLLNLQVISATQNLKKTNRFKPGAYPYPCCLLHG